MGAMRTAEILFVGAVVTLAASCAPVRVEPETGAIAARIRDAEAAGGREDPAAARYLALAERELSRAQLLERVRDAQGAESWARRAAADADVARLLAIETALREAARRTAADAEALYQRLERRR